MNKNRQLLQEAFKGTGSNQGPDADDDQQSKIKDRTSILGERQRTISEVLKGKKRTVLQLKVNPAKCRMWERHNRRYDLLSEARCRDLIEGFKSAGQQEFPAIVREVDEGSDIEYEVICGARRHWTANYLGWDLLVEVRELDDEQAFRLSDLENRDREDIADYERALDYVDALGRYYESQKQMAERLECTEKWLSQYLDLARLPQEIVVAYPDIRDLKIYHGTEIKKLLKEPSNKRRLLNAAKEMKGTDLKGNAVFAALKKAAKGVAAQKGKNVLSEYTARKTNRKMLTVARGTGGDVTLRLHKASGATRAELMAALDEVLEKYLAV